MDLICVMSNYRLSILNTEVVSNSYVQSLKVFDRTNLTVTYSNVNFVIYSQDYFCL